VQEEEWQRQASRDRVAMRRRQIQLGQVLQGIATYAVRGWQSRIEQKLPLDLRPDEVLAMMKLGSEMETRGHGEEKDGGRFTRIVVRFGTTTDQNLEESCRKNGGRALPPGGDVDAPMSFEEFDAQQYQQLSEDEKAAEATWRDPPRKLN
jgi:hypothetical protein